MGVLEALGGWQNVNQEKLEQIKVDNPPLYDAISKALNLLAKKYGGEDIIIQKPIEVAEEVIPATQRGQLTDYQILKKIEILSMAKGDWPTKMQILDSFIYEIGFDENEIGAIGDFEQDFYAKLAELAVRDLIRKVGNEYKLSYAGQALINSYELQNKQVEENRESRELSDLEKSILLSQRRGDKSSFKDIFESVEKVALQKFQLDISYLGLREKLEAIEKLVEDGYLNKFISGIYNNAYILTEKGEDAVNEIISYGGQPPQETPSDEDLKLEILTRMTDYYDGADYNLLNQDDIITNAVKHQFDIPSNKYFGLVVKLLGDGFVEKDPSGLTDSIRLTNKGYDKAMDWFEENLPEEGAEANQYDFPQDRLEGILKRLSEARAKIHDYVSIEDLKRQLYDVVVPLNYPTFESKGFPSLESDLKIMEGMGLVKSRITLNRTTQIIDTEFDIDTKGSEMLTQLKLEEAQQQKASSLRPSPSESATLFSTGRIKVGNDGNLWKVTETKNGVKRWTKVGDIPTDEPAVEEPPISEITEDEVDLDLLEQQLNDDSLEFDLNEEDLDNLEF